MNRHLSLLAFPAALLTTAAVLAQQTPHVGYVFPAGGQQGRTFEIRVGGQFLDGVDYAQVSGPGVSVKVVQLIKPMNQMQANQLREKLRMLMEKKYPGSAATAAKPGAKAANSSISKPDDTSASKPVTKPAAPANRSMAGFGRPIMLSNEEEQMIVDIRKKLAKFVARPPVPAIAETAVLQATVASDAKPGVRELRLETPAGLSNPLVFQIGNLAEVVNKRVDNDDAPPRVPLAQLRARGPAQPPSQPTVDVELPTVVNGQILSGQVNRYRFRAKKGQHLVIAVSAQQLMPYIADAVPGWFQAAVTLRDEHGAELAYAANFRFHPDPVLSYEVLHDGKYTVEIHDSVFRGREDFVYRMAIGELPYATDMFPLGGKAGTVVEVAVQGWNLPFTSLTADDSRKSVGSDMLAGHRERKLLNDLSFAWDALPECVEQEPNDSPEHAQLVTLPIIINGRINRPGDHDVFRFEGKAGQEVVAEVNARRLGSPFDSVLRLTDAAGTQLAFNDDCEDPACGLITHHADSYLKTRLPAAGTYNLHLYDAQRQGGPEYGYRLRISPPQPDFDLRIVPSSVNVRGGGAAPITIHALRRDGFNGPIELKLKDAPAGYRLSGATIPAGQQKVRCTLSAPLAPDEPPVALTMIGRATIQGLEVRRAAVPADDMMQAFYYYHLVPAQQWLVASIGSGRGSVMLAPHDAQTVKLPSGGVAVLHFVGRTARWSECCGIRSASRPRAFPSRGPRLPTLAWTSPCVPMRRSSGRAGRATRLSRPSSYGRPIRSPAGRTRLNGASALACFPPCRWKSWPSKRRADCQSA